MRLRLAPLAFIVASFAMSGPVLADDYNGGGKDAPPLTPQQLYLSELKSNVASAYLAHRKAGGSPADFPQEEIASLENALNGGQPFSVSVPASYPSAYSYNQLSSVVWQAQINDCFCGPASAYMALASRGTGNNYFGAALDQNNLSTSYWLQTDQNCPGNGTPRTTNWRFTLNGWVDNTADGWYLLTNYGYADAADVATKVVMDVDYGYAPVFNIWMSNSRGWLQGWSDVYGPNIYHYVPGYGYTGYGDYFSYVEVWGQVTAGAKWGTTKETFASILSSMGLVW